MEDKTIAAIATALSPAGISIIRISGKESWIIVDRIFHSKNGKKLSVQKSHTIHYGYIIDNQEILDEVLILLFKGPHSYTAEDTVEIHCHGGIYVTKKVFSCVLKNGAFPAEPGEFTKRAFLNGRLDLAEAESVAELIEAKNEFARKNAVNGLKGVFSIKIIDLRNDILNDMAFIEATLDDPEHFDISNYGEKLKKNIEFHISQMKEWIGTFDDGKVLSEGIKTAIIGKPNAGKSSLLNKLMGIERAIVTDIPGTTRDILEEQIYIHGMGLQLMDTAGIRETENVIEKIGINRAKKSVEDADLILFVIDSSQQLDDEDEYIFHLIEEKKAIVVLNKNDLITVIDESLIESKFPYSEIVSVSASDGSGIPELIQKIEDLYHSGQISYNNEIVITKERHRAALADGIESLNNVLKSIDLHLPEDFFTIDLMDAYISLGSILGETVEEDLVNRIFSKFCMGK